MAIPTFNAVGFCAHYSKQGDWAFQYALRLSEKYEKKLNVFHFLGDPYEKEDDNLKKLSLAEKDRIAIEKEKELRMYYDNMSGEYLNVGFRLCYDRSWIELHRCLLVREFQILILGYPSYNAFFANKPIEEFAKSFVPPVVLVGPNSPYEYHLNNQAELIIDSLDIKSGVWSNLSLELA